MERRRAYDRRRCRVHVQPVEGQPGPGPQLHLVGAEERQPERGQRGAHLRQAGRAVLFLRGRPGRRPAPARLGIGQKRRYLQRRLAGGHRPLHADQVHGPEHHLRGQPQLLATGPAQGEDDRVPGVYVKHAGQRGAGYRSGPAGGPVHPQHQGFLHFQELRATTIGSLP